MKTENVNRPPTHPCGNSAARGGVYEQRHATQRILPESGFELRHAESSPEEATLEEKEQKSFFRRPVAAGGVGRREIASAARIEVRVSRGAVGRGAGSKYVPANELLAEVVKEMEEPRVALSAREKIRKVRKAVLVVENDVKKRAVNLQPADCFLVFFFPTLAPYQGLEPLTR